jgi:hypothetical protein
LRHPDLLDRLRAAPDLLPAAVEEMPRYEPPVQFLPHRSTLGDIPLAGTTIPRGVVVTLAPAAGNRAPAGFSEPERFDPERRDNAHLGFRSGIHLCFGAPLARAEAQIAFAELGRRLGEPQLVVDPPPYRPSPTLRGPEHLLRAVEGLRTAGKPPVGRPATQSRRNARSPMRRPDDQARFGWLLQDGGAPALPDRNPAVATPRAAEPLTHCRSGLPQPGLA